MVVKLKVWSTPRGRERQRREKSANPPAVHSTYFELYRRRADRHGLYQKLVVCARAHGLQAAAREFGCSRNTVRKWLRRDQPGQPLALVERSRRPKRSPNRSPRGWKAKSSSGATKPASGPNASSGNSAYPAAPTAARNGRAHCKSSNAKLRTWSAQSSTGDRLTSPNAATSTGPPLSTGVTMSPDFPKSATLTASLCVAERLQFRPS